MNWATLAILGLGAGGIYALSALGVVLAYRSSGILNFAHPAIGLVGVVAFVEVRPTTGTVAAIIVGLLVSAALGALTLLAIVRPLRDATTLMHVIATIAIALTIYAGVSFLLKPDVEPVTGYLPEWQVSIFDNPLSGDRILILLIAGLLTSSLWAVYKFTRFGLQSSAVAEDPKTAALYGISADLVRTFNWAVAGALSALAGILIVPITGLTIAILSASFIPVLAAALLGGLRSFPMTLLGGLIIGSTQAVLGPLFPGVAGLSTAVPFLLIMVALLVGGRRLSFKARTEQRLPSVGSGVVGARALQIGAGIALVLVWSVMTPAWIDAATVSLGVATVLLSLVVVTGYGGQISLVQFTIAGFGAWIAALLTVHFGAPFLVAASSAVLAALGVGIVVGLPALRIRGVHLAVVTLGFAAMIDAMVFKNPRLNGGFGGVFVGFPTIFGMDVNAIIYPERYFVVALVTFVVLAAGLSNIRRGSVGRRLLAVRANDRAAASVGINVTATKLYAFAVGSAIAAAGGVVLAFRNPNVLFGDYYPPEASSTMLAEAVIGGIGWLTGPLLGVQAHPGSLGGTLIEGWFGDTGRWLDLFAGVLLLAIIYLHPDGLAPVNARIYRAIRGRLSTPRARPPDLAEMTTASRGTRPPAALEVCNISVHFGGVCALDNASLIVAPGEIVGLIGPNGSGKSTMVEAIAGAVRPQTGSIKLGERDLRDCSPHRRVRSGLGRTFQSLELFEDMSVLDNVSTAADRTRWTRYLTDLLVPRAPALSPSAARTIEEFGLTNDLSTKVSELSFGKRRLVAIARALASEPCILLLDEPAAGLGNHDREELGRLLRQLVRGGQVGVLLVEHDIDLVMDVCDEIVALESGSVIAAGTPETVRLDPDVIRSYLGTPSPSAELAQPHPVGDSPVTSTANVPE